MRPQQVLTGISVLVLYLFAAAGCTSQRMPGPVLSLSQKEERIAYAKQSTVRIYVDGKPRGSGFIISENGLIATAFHVIAKIHPTPYAQPHIAYASSIEVQLYDGERLPALVHSSCISRGLRVSMVRDFCILEIKTSKKLAPLRLGDFADAREGSTVYVAGYHLLSDQPCVSFGTVSVKWENPVVSYHGQLFSEKKHNTSIALLDITMHRGDSGGPIILVGKTPDEDRVIGIASFMSNPLDQETKALIDALKKYVEDRYDVVCTLELFHLLQKERGSGSLFIRGCISIEPLKRRLEAFAAEQERANPMRKRFLFF